MIQVEQLSTRLGGQPVLEDISLTLAPGEVMAVIGPSGSGKSTLLRSLNFLVEPHRGRITVGGQTVDVARASKQEKLALRRKCAMVFQNYHLFQNKTALENILLPLTAVQKISKPEALRRAEEILEIIHLPEKRDRYPSQLSGGEQQRVGIGRALAVNAELILCDEPTSSLDPELVAEVLDLIRDLAARKITMLIATHEMAFARESAQQVLFLDGGRVAAAGTPQEVLGSAAPARVREFLGGL